MREEIEERPLAATLLGLIFGLIVFHCPTVVFGLVVALWVLRPAKIKSILGIAFVVGMALAPVAPDSLKSAIPIHDVGLVASVPQLSPDAQICELDIGERRLLLVAPRVPPVTMGDQIRVVGAAKPIQSLGDSKRFEVYNGRVQVDSFEIVRQGSWLTRLADGWRRSFMEFTEHNLSSKNASLVDAVCFNARTMLDPVTKAEMANSGAVHLISSAGIQVIMFGLLINLALRFLPIARSSQLLIWVLVLTIYAIATGLQPQVIRTVVVTILGLSAYLTQRDSDALSALCLAGTGYLIWRPESIFGMGFQFSFITAGLVTLFYHRSRSNPKDLKGVVIRSTNDYFRLTGVILLATTPLVAYYLGIISLSSIFANLLLCGSVPVMVAVAFVAHGISWVAPVLADSIASHLLSPVCDWVNTTIGWFGEGGGRVDVPAFSSLWLIAFYGAWLLTYRRRVVQP